jgi:hypothetical protein
MSRSFRLRFPPVSSHQGGQRWLQGDNCRKTRGGGPGSVWERLSARGSGVRLLERLLFCMRPLSASSAQKRLYVDADRHACWRQSNR